MDTLIEIICFSDSCKFSEFKPAVYCCFDECIRSSVGLLIRDVFIVIFQRTPPASCSDSDKHACKTNQIILAGQCIHH